MRKLPWLIYAGGPESARREVERTERAALDLAAVAERIDGYLVLHEAVDIGFDFTAQHLPPGTVDLRDGDPLALALADPAAVVVSAGGIFIGTPIERDPRWAQLDELGRSRVLLGTSALSGAYYGCRVYGPVAGRYLDGVAEEGLGLAARLVYVDGSVLEVERTTIGYRSSGKGEPYHGPSLARLIGYVPGMPSEVTSELLDFDELAAALAEADRLPPATLTLNGRRWFA